MTRPEGQRLYREHMRQGIAGMLGDLNIKSIFTRTISPGVAQVDTVTVAVATDSDWNEIDINGITTRIINGTGSTTAGIAAAFVAALQANPDVIQVVQVQLVGSTIVITSLVPGVAFTTVVSSQNSGDLTLAHTTANAAESPVLFGQGVVRAAVSGYPNTDKLVKLPSSGSDIFSGIVVHEHIMQEYFPTPPGLTEYHGGQPIGCLILGVIWVPIEQDVDPTLPVYLRYTANGLLTPGNFRVDADTSKAALLPMCNWLQSNSASLDKVGLLKVA